MLAPNDTDQAPAAPPSQPGFVSRVLGLASDAPAAPDLTTPAGIRQAYAAGKITRQAAVQALVGKPFQPTIPRD